MKKVLIMRVGWVNDWGSRATVRSRSQVSTG